VQGLNDVFKLEHFVFHLLRTALSPEEYLLVSEEFRKVILKTTIGQGLDLEYSRSLSQLAAVHSVETGRELKNNGPSKESPKLETSSKALRKRFSLANYGRIVMYKTSFYTFYLPLMAALCLGGGRGKQDSVEDARKLAAERRSEMARIGLELGHYYQAQDDFLDVYGDPQRTGKAGTDIEQHKLTWLMATAIEKADDMTLQRLIFRTFDLAKTADSSSDTEKDSKYREREVAGIFRTLGLRREYLKYEAVLCKKLRKQIADKSRMVPARTMELILDKIYKSRQAKEGKMHTETIDLVKTKEAAKTPEVEDMERELSRKEAERSSTAVVPRIRQKIVRPDTSMHVSSYDSSAKPLIFKSRLPLY
jgi:geranylgeranyl pyrophosphate synthase